MFGLPQPFLSNNPGVRLLSATDQKQYRYNLHEARDVPGNLKSYTGMNTLAVDWGPNVTIF